MNRPETLTAVTVVHPLPTAWIESSSMVTTSLSSLAKNTAWLLMVSGVNTGFSAKRSPSIT